MNKQVDSTDTPAPAQNTQLDALQKIADAIDRMTAAIDANTEAVYAAAGYFDASTTSWAPAR